MEGTAAAAEQFAALAGDPSTGFNAAVEALTRHPADRVALVWHHGRRRAEFTVGDLDAASAGLAATFAERGVTLGSRVAVLLPRRPELLHTLFAVWRCGGVVVPLFTAFGPAAIATRLDAALADLVVTDARTANRLPADIGVPVLDVDAPGATEVPETAPRETEPLLDADAPFIVLFTSGTAGPPKAVEVPLRALAAFRAYTLWSVDLRPDDRLWCLADPGWAYGLFCGVLGPMLLGHTIRFVQDPFDPVAAADLCEAEGITNLMAAPTAFRAMLPHLRPGSLRVASSAGEHLPARVAIEFERRTGAPLFDHYGQSELGMVAGNHHGLDRPTAPGSFGTALPGFRVAVLDADDQPIVGELGRLAVHQHDSALGYFAGYLGPDGSATPPTTVGDGWYPTGDLATEDAEGRLWFEARADDVVVTSGYRVGPTEVEEHLERHDGVAECVVVGRPDAARGHVLVAFVVPTRLDDLDRLLPELRAWVRRGLAAHLVPREVRVMEELPRTASGKPQRYVLRRALETSR